LLGGLGGFWCHDSTTSRHPPLEINAKCELLLQAPRVSVPPDKEWGVLSSHPCPHPPQMGIRTELNPYSVWLLGRQVHWNVWQLQLCGNKLLCNTQTSQEEGSTPSELEPEREPEHKPKLNEWQAAATAW